jgi:glutathione S-transferase
MELYDLPHSPYAARVRMYIYSRNLPVQLSVPPGGLGSDTYKSLTVSSKVPILNNGGAYLAESSSIIEYLEGHFPDGALSPTDPWKRAQQSAMIRYIDLYFAQALFPLFQQLRAAPRDEAVVASALSKLQDELLTLERWYQLPELQPTAALTIVDCAVIPVLFYVHTLAPLFGVSEPLAATPVLTERWSWAEQHAVANRVIEEMAAGLKAVMSPAK